MHLTGECVSQAAMWRATAGSRAAWPRSACASACQSACCASSACRNHLLVCTCHLSCTAVSADCLFHLQNDLVIDPKGMGSWSLMHDASSCPMCHSAFTPETAGFFGCSCAPQLDVLLVLRKLAASSGLTLHLVLQVPV